MGMMILANSAFKGGDIPRSRTVGVVSDTIAPIVTYAFMGGMLQVDAENRHQDKVVHA